MTVSVAGKRPKLDPEGYLCQLTDWSPEVAQWLAEQEGIKLSDDHWAILYRLRDFYHTFELAPAMRPLTRYLRQHLPAEKTTSIHLMQLFGSSPAKMAAKLAGLPKPDNCL
ncbi:TusE/DsrC/DsvC family sulfur relay protein [Marinospirillum sp.]|uniref:TusE/DsrC/DsvC family sulfur relay protein n=1 Tax=Marinospirillum sp. TaxID=2183934 RepID=UPI003A839D22